MEAIKEVLNRITGIFSTMIPIVDLIDILIVSVLLYYAFMFVRERRAGKLAIGVVLLVAALFVSELVGMKALSFIIENIMQVGLLALIIIFQPELRSILEKMGGGLKTFSTKRSSETVTQIDELTTACADLSESRTGALIAIERQTKLGDEIKTGIEVNADIKAALIKNIFFNKAPLHDGAMIIRSGKIHSCGCFLPLSQNQSINKNFGTRHRAALGLSEISDAIVIVVSEETGSISIAKDGKIHSGYDKYSLQNKIINLLNIDDEHSANPIRRFKRKSDK